jgi:ADP-ribose pyrophosphatase
MSNRLDAYLRFAEEYPHLFQNPTADGLVILLDPADIALVEAQMRAQLVAQGLPSSWAEVGIIQEDQYAMILRDAVRFPDGRQGTYRRQINHPRRNVPGVAILPIWQDQLLLIRQFRHAPRCWCWEIPRGIGELDSSPEENVRRELLEEIRATEIMTLIHLGKYHWNTGVSDDWDHLYLAHIQGYGSPEYAEGITAIQAVSITEFEALLAQQKISDGYTLAAYALAKARKLLPA